jgi:hypothetical protein
MLEPPPDLAPAAMLSPALGEASRRAALAGFMDLFAPGNIVDLARPTVPERGA